MFVEIREERPDDVAAIGDLNKRAFGQDQEANIVDALRSNGAVLLSLVATLNGRVVGHIMYSPLSVGNKVTGAALGPMAVLPEYQRQGIGSKLVEAGNRKLKDADVTLNGLRFHYLEWPNQAVRYSINLKTAKALGLTIPQSVLNRAAVVIPDAAPTQDEMQHQHAVAGLGTVDFPTSCNAAAQKWISRGAALLHSFGYEEARIAFNDAAKADPTCAMAYWGVARTWYHPIWAPPSRDELRQGAAALDRALAIDTKTGRERDYINALAVFYKDWQTVDHMTRAKNYEQALAKVCERNPNDDEATIFHALQLVAIGYLDPTDKTYTWQRKGGEILNQVLPQHQNHPGVAHYIIHSVDYPSLAELGLKAARAYARIAPDSPHALHMPSHIFTRLGMWDDSIASNTASAKSAIAQAQRLHGGGGAFDQLHAMDYLVYAYLQQAKDTSARKVLAEMEDITRLDENQFAAAYAFAASPARWALERHDWKAAAALQIKPAWFPWNRFRNAEALVHYARAIGAARAGDVVAARRSDREQPN